MLKIRKVWISIMFVRKERKGIFFLNLGVKFIIFSDLLNDGGLSDKNENIKNNFGVF